MRYAVRDALRKSLDSARLVLALSALVAGTASANSPYVAPVTCGGPLNSGAGEANAINGVFDARGDEASSFGQPTITKETAQTFTMPALVDGGAAFPGTITFTITRTADTPTSTPGDWWLYVDLTRVSTNNYPPVSTGNCLSGNFPDVVARAKFSTADLQWAQPEAVTLRFEYDERSGPLVSGQVYALIFHTTHDFPTNVGIASNMQEADYYTEGYAYVRHPQDSNGCFENPEWVRDLGRDINFCMTFNDGLAIDGGSLAPDAGADVDATFGSDSGSDLDANPPPDSGASADAAVSSDAGLGAEDAGSQDDGGENHVVGVGGGCSCHSVPQAELLLLSLVGALTRRRRISGNQ
jgi:MYXO-CTERM domain-containing protein